MSFSGKVIASGFGLVAISLGFYLFNQQWNDFNQLLWSFGLPTIFLGLVAALVERAMR